MATEVYTVEEIVLQDGTTIELRPLVIKRLRRFMSKFEEFGKAEDEETATSLLVECAAICISKQVPELASNIEELEDVLDMPTLYKIIEICGGVKLNDPKLLEMAEKIAMENARQ